MGKRQTRKFVKFDDIQIGAKSVTYSETLEHFAKHEDKRDPYTREHAEYMACGCAQCKLIVHSRSQCGRRKCFDVACCSTTITVTCKSSGYKNAVILPFAVKVTRQSNIRMSCRYCDQIILEANKIEDIIRDKQYVYNMIQKHICRIDLVNAFVMGTIPTYTHCPIKMLDQFTIEKIASFI